MSTTDADVTRAIHKIDTAIYGVRRVGTGGFTRERSFGNTTIHWTAGLKRYRLDIHDPLNPALHMTELTIGPLTSDLRCKLLELQAAVQKALAQTV